MILSICMQLMVVGLTTACTRTDEDQLELDIRNATVAPGYRIEVVTSIPRVQTNLFSAMDFDSAGNLLVASAVTTKSAISYIVQDQEGCYNSPLTSNVTLAHDRYGYYAVSMDVTMNDTLFVANVAQDKFGLPYTSVWMQIWNATNPGRVASNATLVVTDLEYDNLRRSMLSGNGSHLIVAQDGPPGQDFTDDLSDPNTPNGKLKAFDLRGIPAEGYNFSTDGQSLAQGLAFPGALARAKNGGFWVINNAAKYYQHSTNQSVQSAGELLLLNSSTEYLDYGFPHCYIAWSNAAPNVTQGTVASDNETDPSACNGTAKAYLLLDPAYYANSMATNANFTELWFSTGELCNYGASVSMIKLDSMGMPIVPNPKDPSSAVNRVVAVNTSTFPDSSPCVGPVSLVIDKAGDVIVSTWDGLYKISRTTATASGASKAFLQNLTLSTFALVLLAACLVI